MHVPPASGDTCAAGPQPSGRPCVGRDSEGHSRHQMGQDGVFRRNWLKLLTANTVSFCGHASIPHIRTAHPFFFFSLVCLSGLSSAFQTRESSGVFILILYKGEESLHRASAAKISQNVIVESEILTAFTNFLKQIQNILLIEK